MYMCFAGVEDAKTRALMARIGQKHILMSFYYLRNKVKDIDAFIEDMKNFDTVLIDSGAYTFFTNDKFQHIDGEGAFAKKKALMDEYVDIYAKFLSKVKDSVTGAFEMDFDVGFGSKICWEWYEKLRASGARIIPVYHGDLHDKNNAEWVEDTPAVFEQWCASGRYEYISIGSSFFQDPKYKPQVSMLARIAKKYGVRLHGLGATGFNDIKNAQLYTVDSTSWLSGDRFGSTYLFQNGRVKAYDNKHKSVRKRWRSSCLKYKIDFKKLVADEQTEVRAWNALQWKLFADAMEIQHKNRKMEYWLVRRLEGKMAENLRGDEKKSNVFDEVTDEEMDTDEDEGVVVEDGEMEEQPSEEGENTIKMELIIPDNIAKIVKSKMDKYDSRGLISNSGMLVAGVLCTNCYLGDRCPTFVDNSVCSLGMDVTVDNGTDMLMLMKTLLEVQTERMIRGVYVEKMDGGMINGEVSKEIDKTVALVRTFKEMTEQKNEVTITAKGQGTGILAQIFGLGGDKK